MVTHINLTTRIADLWDLSPELRRPSLAAIAISRAARVFVHHHQSTTDVCTSVIPEETLPQPRPVSGARAPFAHEVIQILTLIGEGGEQKTRTVDDTPADGACGNVLSTNSTVPVFAIPRLAMLLFWVYPCIPFVGKRG